MDDEELVKEFLVESHENLDQLDQDLVTLEGDPTNPEILSRIFRTFHTIKGTCGFLGFTKLEWVTHVGESLLSPMRDGKLLLNDEITTALLSLVDAVREILSSIETTQAEGDTNYEDLIETLTRLKDTPQVAATADATDTSEDAMSADSPTLGDEVTMEASGDLEDAVPSSNTPADEDDEIQRKDVAERATEDEEAIKGGVIKGGAEKTVADARQKTLALDNALTQPDDLTREAELKEAVQDSGIDHRIEQYLMESYEHTDQLDRDLVSLESDPTNQVMLTRIVGTLHTLKSSSGFMGFAATESAAHAGENLLIRLREGRIKLSPEIATALLSLVDMVRQALVSIETSGRDADIDYRPLIETLAKLQQEEQKKPPPKTEPVEQPVAKTSKSQARAPSVADTSIRVDVGLLDRLMDQVGELVLARNRIMQFANIQEDRVMLAAYQRLDLITSELQEGVMKTRMQTIGTIWNKFPRVVRDLARECGKQVDLRMEGEETELDRTLIEAIRDPLTHLVRNAVDHGIETPDERRQAGKAEAGTLFLRAFHEGGQVNINISDDGGGIDPKRIAERALQRNVITSGQAAAMSDREILNLIFLPGFSTAQTVTNVSGRGVGMDVVKNNIDRINGSIDIQSEVGKGSTINIKIPLTLAIIPALIIRCQGDRYAIPQANLIELLRIEGEDAGAHVETIQGAPVYRLRGDLLPLVYLADEFSDGLAGRTASSDSQVINIVVLHADQRQFGLVVENVLDTEEIVVKPLGKQVKDIEVFAGATIMGDGQVALILDVLGLAQRANVLSERGSGLDAGGGEKDGQRVDNYQTLLLFESTHGQRMAMPLSRVTRLEKFDWSKVEKSGPHHVIQYWGEVMPLIDLPNCLDSGGDKWIPKAIEREDRDNLEVVVLTVESKSIGLIVGRILDTVEGAFEVQSMTSRQGIAGTIVVQGKATELVDLEQVIQAVDPGLQAAIVEVEG